MDDEPMQWWDVPEVATCWASMLGDLAAAIKRASADVYTGADIGYYVQPDTFQVALHTTNGEGRDLALCKAAASRCTTDPILFLSSQELADPVCTWIKVAYSPVLRRAGELLNFFPGQYPGGIPNSPSPLAAMLTSGLLGAGLGWGAGRLARAALPEGYGEHLGRTGAIMGGTLGILPGAAWAAAGAANGHGLTDPWPLEAPAGSPDLPDLSPSSPLHGDNRVKMGSEIPVVPLGAGFTRRIKAALDTIGGYVEPPDPTPLDVNIDALGRTLWESGASPQLAGATMGAMYTAQQLPDPRSRPGYVTAGQLGEFTARTSGDYLKGLLVGGAINTVVGTPWRAPAFGTGMAALGILGAVVPKLFSSTPV